MASIQKQPGKPNYYCHFRDSSGRRRQHTTGTANMKEAERICNAMQDVSDMIKAGSLTPAKARKLIEDLAGNVTAAGKANQWLTIAEFFRDWLRERPGLADEIIRKPQPGQPEYNRLRIFFEHMIEDMMRAGGDSSFNCSSIEAFFLAWIETVKGEVTSGTAGRYKGIVDSFLKHLGPARSRKLSSLTVQDVQRYRDTSARRMGNSTTNLHLKVLRIGLESALASKQIEANPAKQVNYLDTADRHYRRAFKFKELDRIYEKASDDWRGMILFSLYTGGLRIADCANLREANVDLQQKEFWTGTKKTRRTQTLPLAAPLIRWLEQRKTVGIVATAPLFPTLHGKRPGWLSNQFYDLMSNAGLVPARDHKAQKKKKGRSSRRELSEISFHSIRHTATTLLKQAGVSDVIARDIVGHESAAISREYTHIDVETKRKALNQMPDLLRKFEQHDLQLGP